MALRALMAPTCLLLLLAACAASSPRLARAITIEPGNRTRVVLQEPSAGASFVLQNRSSGSRAQVYGDARGDAMAKVVDDNRMQQLLDVLAEQGLFAHATATQDASARAAITVEHQDRVYCWTRAPRHKHNTDVIRQFDECRGYVLAVFNSETSYHARQLDDPEAAQLRNAIEQQKADQQRKGKL